MNATPSGRVSGKRMRFTWTDVVRRPAAVAQAIDRAHAAIAV